METPGALRETDAALLVIRELVPRVDRQFREAHAHPAGLPRIERIGADFEAHLLAEELRARDLGLRVEVERIEGVERVAVDGDAEALPDEVPESSSEFDLKLAHDGRDAAVVEPVALRPAHEGPRSSRRSRSAATFTTRGSGTSDISQRTISSTSRYDEYTRGVAHARPSAIAT
jgi:hypothetical protein